MNESNIAFAEPLFSAKPLAAALAVLVAIAAMMALSGTPQASAQEHSTPVAAAQGLTMHEGVDWSKVKATQASPAHPIAAYDR